MNAPRSRDVQRRDNEAQRTADVEAVARVVGSGARMSFVQTELLRNDRIALEERQRMLGELGEVMSRRSREVVTSMAESCATEEERVIAYDFAKSFHGRSVQAFDGLAAKAYGQQ